MRYTVNRFEMDNFSQTDEFESKEEVIQFIYIDCLAISFNLLENIGYIPRKVKYVITFDQYSLEIISIGGIHNFYEIANALEKGIKISNVFREDVVTAVKKIMLGPIVLKTKENMNMKITNIEDVYKALISLGINPINTKLSYDLFKEKKESILSLLNDDLFTDSINNLAISGVIESYDLLVGIDQVEISSLEQSIKSNIDKLKKSFSNLSLLIITYKTNIFNLGLTPSEKPTFVDIQNEYNNLLYRVTNKKQMIEYATFKKAAYNYFLAYKDIIPILNEVYLNINPSYNNQNKSQGCYVATSIYGSYDCPEVWILRRYRDQCLNKNIIGRIFIRWYYKVSPILVAKLENRIFIKKIVKKSIDKKLVKLRKKGYLDTKYDDLIH
jgi:hypothetical protein